MGQACKVNNDIDVFTRVIAGGQAATNDFNLRRPGLVLNFDRIAHQGLHRPTLGQQFRNQFTSDKTAGTCHQYFHGSDKFPAINSEKLDGGVHEIDHVFKTFFTCIATEMNYLA